MTEIDEQYEKRYYISIKNEESAKKNTKNWYTINALGGTLEVHPLYSFDTLDNFDTLM